MVNVFVDESLRAHEHPGVVFRSGPTGRRAALAGGPDVWEVIASFHAVRDEAPRLDGDALVAELGATTGLSREQIGAALRYYAAYPDEVDERVVANREAADREERLWRSEQHLLRRGER